DCQGDIDLYKVGFWGVIKVWTVAGCGEENEQWWDTVHWREMFFLANGVIGDCQGDIDLYKVGFWGVIKVWTVAGCGEENEQWWDTVHWREMFFLGLSICPHSSSSPLQLYTSSSSPLQHSSLRLQENQKQHMGKNDPDTNRRCRGGGKEGQFLFLILTSERTSMSGCKLFADLKGYAHFHIKSNPIEKP
nr:NHL domain-containing protein [Tanacetum cinerariifolium]